MQGDAYDKTMETIAETLTRVDEKLKHLGEHFKRLDADLKAVADSVTTLKSERDKLVGGAGVFFTIATALGGLLAWFIDKIVVK